jgi:hypothetical protein
MRSRDSAGSVGTTYTILVQPFVLYKTPNGYLNGVRVCVCVMPPLLLAAAAWGSALAHIIWQSRNLLSLNSSSTNYENVRINELSRPSRSIPLLTSFWSPQLIEYKWLYNQITFILFYSFLFFLFFLSFLLEKRKKEKDRSTGGVMIHIMKRMKCPISDIGSTF